MKSPLHSVIDVDIHPLLDPAAIARRLPQPWRRRYEEGNHGSQPIGYWNPNGVRRPDAQLPDGRQIDGAPALLAQHYFDPYGVEYGLLNVDDLFWAVTPEPDFAASVASAINDVLVEEWLPADPRLRASLHVSPVDPVLAAREIRRVGAHPGVVQVYLPGGAPMPYGQRFYHPIYEAACEMKLPVAIHPGVEGSGLSGRPGAAGYPGGYLEWHTGLVQGYIAHLLSLLCEGTFQRYPTMKFVLLEGGVSWLPPVLWRLDKNWKGLRLTVPWLDRLPSEVAFDHVRLSTQPLEEPQQAAHLAQILEMFPAERMLMFSSDYPHWDGDTPDFAGRMFKGDLRRCVMSETARDLYGLPVVARV